jgi:hypothetical protein
MIKRGSTSFGCFKEFLYSWGGTWMWEHIRLFGPMAEIAQALRDGTAICVTDGSFNPNTNKRISGAGWLIYCSNTDKILVEGSFAEDHPRAGSYRGELLGLLAIHLFVSAVKQYYDIPQGSYGKICCDNQGAIYRAGRRRKRIASSIPNADLLRVLRDLHHRLGRAFRYEHVHGHQDDYALWSQLSLEAQLNVRCDHLAKEAVARNAFLHGDQQSQILPREAAAVFVGGIKQTSEVGDNLRFHAGSVEARRFYTHELGWTDEAFQAVDWPSLDATLKSKPKMFHVWLCKQASDFSASGVQMGRWFGRDCTACPNCGTNPEHSRHLLFCPDQDRSHHLQQCITDLTNWLHKTSDPSLAHFTGLYYADVEKFNLPTLLTSELTHI